MNRSYCTATFALLCLSMLAACHRPAALRKAETPDKPRVAEWKPGDELERLDQALTLTFDRPMVGSEAVGPVLAKPPVAVEPAQPLRVYWEDVKTLQVLPETLWKAGRRYRLVAQGELAAQLSAALPVVFDAQPPRLSWMTLAGDNAAREPDFEATFTLPVDPAAVVEHCKLLDDKGVRIALREAPSKHPNEEARDPQRVHLATRERLPLDTHYVLDCSGLVAAGGDAPWRGDPKARGFTTHGLLELSQHWPARGPELPPERAKLCLELTTPVDLKQLARHVHVSPSSEGIDGSWSEDSCGDEWHPTHRANSILFAPRQHFVVKVDAALTDVFGQQLGREQHWEFTTSDRIPGLWTSVGFGFVLEAGREGHALGALNLERAALRCSQLTPAQLAANYEHFEGWVNQRPERDEVAQPAPWDALKLTPRVHVFDAKAAPNQARKLALDLGAHCGAGEGRPGLYAFELEPQGRALEQIGRQGAEPARMFADVTDLAVVAKRGQSSAVVWVSQLSNGALVADAAVDLLSDKGRVIASARSDALGLARFARLPKREADELFAIKKGDDVAIVGSEWIWHEGFDSWQLGVREGDDESVRLFVHTDRGVYRPGERVLVHGLAREINDVAPARIPKARAVALNLKENSDTVYERTLSLSDFGSFAAQIQLPPHMTPGSHTLTVTVAGKTETYPITVAEFRPLTFELTGGPERDALLAGESVKLALSARYLFGAPLANAELHYTVERAKGQVSTQGLDEFRFEDDAPSLPKEEPWPEPAEGVVFERDEKTGKQGQARLSFPTEAGRRPVRYLITVAASDESKARATRSFSVLAHSAERYVGTHMLRYVFGEGEPVQAEVVLVDRDGKPVAGDAELELRHEVWSCADPLTRCRVEAEILGKQSVHVAAEQPTLANFDVHTRGSVHIRAITHDGAGREARASDAAWVWSAENAGPYNDRVATTLSTDRRAYQVGDSARLALQTTLAPAHLLVTAERGDVLSAQIVPSSAGMPLVALGATAAPNVFLTVTGVTPRGKPGDEGRPHVTTGAKEVAVRAATRALDTKITLANDHYEPHARVEGDIEVTHLGKPVAAEVALVAVNESVLQLTGFETPDPTKVFHAARGLSVTTLSNITRVLADPGLDADVPAAARLDTHGEDGGGGRPDLRDDYVAAAYFAPDLRSDDKGRVHFAFDAPTDLSAYRLMVVAAAKDDRVGSGAQRFTVSQPLSAHMLAPRFASRGDTIELGALVHDATAVPGPTEVSFDARGFTLDRKHAQVSADPAGSAVRTRALVENVDRAWFEVELHKGQAADRVRHTLEVRRPLDTELRVLALGRTAKTSAKLEWPQKIDRALSQLELTVDRAGLAPLAPVLTQVIDYPYGCSEQTASALAAIAAAPELARAVVPGLQQPAQLDARIADGVGRLLQARAPDGHFGLYPGMNGRPWLTAFVLDTALALRELKAQVPDALTTGAASALGAWLAAHQDLRSTANPDLELAAYAAVLLTRMGSAPAEPVLDALYAQRARLTIDGTAHLLRVAALTGRPESFRSPLRDALRTTPWLGRERDPEQPFSSAERSAALALLALLADGEDPALAAKLARFLIERAADPENYMSTRDVADTLGALASFAKSAQAGASNVRITLGSRVLWQGSLSGAQVLALAESANTAITGDIAVEADGEVSVSIRRKDVAASAPRPAFAHGFAVTRRYLDPKTQKPIEKLALGDIIQVELELRTERAVRMLALEDPLPAGLEPLDPGLSSGRVAGCDSCDGLAGFDHIRRHDDRIEAFAEWLPTGTQKLRYMLRATTPGTFSSPGAAATLMYLPNYYGRSQVDRVSIEQ